MTLLQDALAAYRALAATDTITTPKTDEDYIQVVIDTILAYDEPLDFTVAPSSTGGTP